MHNLSNFQIPSKCYDYEDQLIRQKNFLQYCDWFDLIKRTNGKHGKCKIMMAELNSPVLENSKSMFKNFYIVVVALLFYVHGKHLRS